MTKVFGQKCSITIYTLFMTLYWTLPVAKSLHWNIASDHIVFGKDILLNCDGFACSPQSIKMWIGGPDNDLICFNVTSSNPSKYEMMVKHNTPSFGLKIKNLTIDDVNCKYTCACGLQQYTRMLDLNTVKYIYPPKIYNYSHVRKEDGCNVDIVMKVYPLPRCFIVYESTENRKIPNAVKEVNSTSVPKTYAVFNESRSTIYKLIRIRQSLQNMGYSYHGGNLYLRCTFESVDKSDFYQNLTICQEEHKDSKTTTTDGVPVSLIVIGVCGCFLLLVIVLACIIIYLFIPKC